MTAPDPLTAARSQLTDAFAGSEVNDRLLAVFRLLQDAAREELAARLGEEFDLLLGAVRTNRRATLAALIAYETALLSTVHTERRTELQELERRLRALESWAYGTASSNNNGDPDDPSGTDAGAHRYG